MKSKRKGRKKESLKETVIREESQVGHGNEVDPVKNLDSKGVLWEEDVMRFLAGER